MRTAIVLALLAPSLSCASKPTEALLQVCLVSGGHPFDSHALLASVQEDLEKNHNVRCTRAFLAADGTLPGLENLETSDAAIFFVRRLTISGEALERVRKYCLGGKPFVGLRGTNHGFENWPRFDEEVLGGKYLGHYKDQTKGPTEIRFATQSHPILAGLSPFSTETFVYRMGPLASDVEKVLVAAAPGPVEEPVAWTRGGRIFYTVLGQPHDFENEAFRRMIVNALFWAASRQSL